MYAKTLILALSICAAAHPRPQPALPEELARESSVFLQRKLGVWTEPDARAVLGAPAKQRYARDLDSAIDGDIYSYPDPTGRYREFELLFDRKSGKLRGIFVYPLDLTWEQCRQLWGSDATRTDHPNGRRFYAYRTRRLDVLVDKGGKVISLGLY